jgi:hypothetical protein
MKTLITKILTFGGLALLVLASCKKDGAIVTVDNSVTTAATLSASTTSPTLTKATLTVNAITFTTTAPKYSYSAAYSNTLQVAVKGTNFAKPKEVPFAGTTPTQSFNIQDFNNILLGLNLPSGTSAQVEVRVKSSLSSTEGIVYSNVLTLTATPFALISYIYVPGSYQSTISTAQWTPATADSLVSPKGNGVYTGYVYFITGGEYKITPAKNWNASYGDAGSGAISLSSGTNLKAPTTTGLYFVTVDLVKNNISLTSADHLWSVIGDGAIDWNTDVDMTFNQNANVYQVTRALVSSGQIKFRADHAWSLSYGDVSPVTGQLTSSNGNNLAVPATGNYLITMNWGDPLLAPTYKLVKQ